MADELKPCPNPWCRSHKGGKQPKVSTLKSIYLSHVRCEGCNLEGPWEDTEAEAITAWNTRTETRVQATIDELVGALRDIEAEMRFPSQIEAGFVHGKPTYKDLARRVEVATGIARTILSRHKGEGE